MKTRRNENNTSFTRMMKVFNRALKASDLINETEEVLERTQLTYVLDTTSAQDKLNTINPDNKAKYLQELETNKNDYNYLSNKLWTQLAEIKKIRKSLLSALTSNEEFLTSYNHLIDVTQQKIAVAGGKESPNPFFEKITHGTYTTLFSPKNDSNDGYELKTETTPTMSK